VVRCAAVAFVLTRRVKIGAREPRHHWPRGGIFAAGGSEPLQVAVPGGAGSTAVVPSSVDTVFTDNATRVGLAVLVPLLWKVGRLRSFMAWRERVPAAPLLLRVARRQPKATSDAPGDVDERERRQPAGERAAAA
jgi:hypothetical protein